MTTGKLLFRKNNVDNIIDCSDWDPDLWSNPGVVPNLNIIKASSDNLTWNEPGQPGCSSPLYDVLKSASASNFQNADCISWDRTNRTATDTSIPEPGSVFFSLIRIKNGCGENLGFNSSGSPRTGANCF